jgi:hypothetical protein
MTEQFEAERLARQFHDTYERLAPTFGYETRPETRAFDPESPNGKLMIAVCRKLAPFAPSGPLFAVHALEAEGTVEHVLQIRAVHQDGPTTVIKTFMP